MTGFQVEPTWFFLPLRLRWLVLDGSAVSGGVAEWSLWAGNLKGECQLPQIGWIEDWTRDLGQKTKGFEQEQVWSLELEH